MFLVFNMLLVVDFNTGNVVLKLLAFLSESNFPVYKHLKCLDMCFKGVMKPENMHLQNDRRISMAYVQTNKLSHGRCLMIAILS